LDEPGGVGLNCAVFVVLNFDFNLVLSGLTGEVDSFNPVSVLGGQGEIVVGVRRQIVVEFQGVTVVISLSGGSGDLTRIVGRIGVDSADHVGGGSAEAS